MATEAQVRKAKQRFMARSVHDINKWTRKELLAHVRNAKGDMTQGDPVLMRWIKVPKTNDIDMT